ncbi:unnamed protein product [Didymodactylos carnosus]|uniref:Uncharacterized protein n=1 Tax=Didymodactylos carnosus TaxID=1234261 RepID=A0A8S2EL01_9BILA|nr:unnamed protein product [Didymodactylos carnosus]CAF4060805.1 unnamed protein product [Didymodactylos carnosus]
MYFQENLKELLKSNNYYCYNNNWNGCPRKNYQQKQFSIPLINRFELFQKTPQLKPQSFSRSRSRPYSTSGSKSRQQRQININKQNKHQLRTTYLRPDAINYTFKEEERGELKTINYHDNKFKTACYIQLWKEYLKFGITQDQPLWVQEVIYNKNTRDHNINLKFCNKRIE